MTPAQRIYGLISLLLLGGYAYLLYQVTTGRHHPEQTVCLFKNATGFACPSCGTTRGLISLLQGDWWQATLLNPLAWLLAAGMILLPLWFLWDGIRRRTSFYLFYLRTEQLLRRHKPLAFVLAVLITCNWCWNIWKGN